MAHIDQLLGMMTQRHAERVILINDQPMKMFVGGVQSAGSTISSWILQNVLLEITPPHLRANLAQDGGFSFPFHSVHGQFDIKVGRSGATTQVAIIRHIVEASPSSNSAMEVKVAEPIPHVQSHRLEHNTQLDQLLGMMTQRHAERVILVNDQPMQMYIGGGQSAGTVVPSAALQNIMNEITPPHLRANLAQDGGFSFSLQSAHGQFDIKVGRNGAKTQVTILPQIVEASPSSNSVTEVKVAEPIPRFQSHELAPNTLLRGGDYRVENELGFGGFGITYRAIDVRLNRPVAVKELYPHRGVNRAGTKVIPKDSSNFEVLKASFIKEGERLARFNSRNIVRVFSIFEENDTAYLVMEFLEGHSLRQVLDSTGCFPEVEAVNVIRQIAVALGTSVAGLELEVCEVEERLSCPVHAEVESGCCVLQAGAH